MMRTIRFRQIAIAAMRCANTARFWWLALVLALAFPVQVAAQSSATISPAVLPDAYQGVYFAVVFTTAGTSEPADRIRYRRSFDTPLPDGLDLNVNGAFSGVPRRTGTYTFTVVSETFSGVTLATRSYTLVVGAQPIQVTPDLPSLTVMLGQPFRVAFTVTGGNAPYRFSGPTGRTYGISSDGVLSGVISQPALNGGVLRVPFQVTDATGLTVFSTYDITVTLPLFATTPVLPAGNAGAVYNQTIVAAGGTAPYRFRPIGNGCGPFSTPSSGCDFFVSYDNQISLPPGLRLEPSGLVTGTPTQAGTYTIRYVVEDATFPEPLQVLEANSLTGLIHRTTITIAPASSLTLTPGALSSGDIGQPYRQLFDASGGLRAYRFALVSGALPPGLTLGEFGLLSGTPTAGGSYAFTIRASDSATPTTQGTMSYTLVIRGPAVEGASITVAAMSGVPQDVDLTRGATGGPFTAANIVSLTPSTAGTARIAAVDVGGVRHYILSFTPSPTFAGSATLRYTLSAGAQTSPEAIVTFNVAPRPDPSEDAEVRGQSNAQADTARRFANAQGRNFGQRLERLHDSGDRRRLEGGLGLLVVPSCIASADGARGCDSAQSDGLFVGPGRRAAGDDSDVSVWVAGSITSGEQDGRDGRVARFDFETDGISLGADLRVSDAFAWGGGIGYGHDTSRIGDNGTRNRATAHALAMYASYRPGQRLFVDGLVGWQRLDYDLRRHVTATGGVVDGQRDGDQWFGAVTAGAEMAHGAWRFAPYARFDLARTVLEAYRERGDPVFALAYDALETDNIIGNLGLRVDYRIETGWGAFEPQARIEYQHDLHGAGDIVVRYADLGAGLPYRASLGESQSSRFNLGLGAAFRFDSGWYLRFDYRGEAGDDTRIEQTIQVSVDRKF